MAEGFVFLVFYIHISIQWEDTEVNWNPLKPDEVAFIAASIKYDKLQCKAGELYSQIATLDCLLVNTGDGTDCTERNPTILFQQLKTLVCLSQRILRRFTNSYTA